MVEVEIEPIITKLASALPVPGTLILIFYVTSKCSAFYTSMSRTPDPPVGVPFGSTFPELFLQVTRENPSLLDGAILVEVGQSSKVVPKVTAWSCRLFPPSNESVNKKSNRGSAYNSAMDFSVLEGVEFVYLLNCNGIIRIKNGSETNLSPLR